ncbi:helix-turn-helix domain-containing protein [uncultured Chryseobacterium sp.]|uniref:helix-turn-helix domain-containing protein n=1 Tax=uncultured Chryseobacterium sp. TaxID=259322 RepID=UPI0025E29C28|nr:helix-turn-helix domain-containing protein [uncultured Chryseobacterium sp.]
MEHSDSGYKQSTIQVPSEFEEVFSHFYFAENRSEHSVVKTLLPSYRMILVFCFGGPMTMITPETCVKVRQCMVIGPVKKAFDYSLLPGASFLAVNFKGNAFFRFFGKPLLAFPSNGLDPDELIPENCFTEIWNQLSQLPSTDERCSCILEFCRPYLQDQDDLDALINDLSFGPRHPVKTAAGITGQSERNIQLRYRNRLGSSAKELHRYHRFLEAIKIIEKEADNRKKTDWFQIITTCGYYDQSQLIRDFKHFIGITPSRYIKFQNSICNPTVG